MRAEDHAHRGAVLFVVPDPHQGRQQPPRAARACERGGDMTITEALDTELPTRSFLELIVAVRETKPRDPLRALEDAVLDLVGRVGHG